MVCVVIGLLSHRRPHVSPADMRTRRFPAQCAIGSCAASASSTPVPVLSQDRRASDASVWTNGSRRPSMNPSGWSRPTTRTPCRWTAVIVPSPTSTICVPRKRRTRSASRTTNFAPGCGCMTFLRHASGFLLPSQDPTSAWVVRRFRLGPGLLHALGHASTLRVP